MNLDYASRRKIGPNEGNYRTAEYRFTRSSSSLQNWTHEIYRARARDIPITRQRC